MTTSSDRLVGLVACAALSTAIALGAAYARGDDADLETARTLLKEGNDLRARDDLRGALAKYKAAHALVFTPITGFEVGRTHMLLGELVAAREAFLAVGRIPVKAKESQNAATARIEAARLAEQLEPRIPSLRVVPIDLAEGSVVAIEIDGTAIPKDAVDAPRRLDPGRHVVVVRATPGPVRTTDVVLAEGERRELKVSMGLQGAQKPNAPNARLVAPGTPTWVYVGIGLAGAGLAVGAVSGALTFSARADLDAGCPDARCPPAQHDRLVEADRWATVSTISFAIAGAAATASLIGWLTRTADERTTKTTVTPVVGLGAIGVQGRF